MKKRLIATFLTLILVFSFIPSALAYSSSTVNINILSYIDSSSTYKPYASGSSQMLYFTVYAKVYQTKTSTTPLVGSQYAQLLQIRATDQSILPMQRKYVWNGDSTNYSSLDANTYYRIRFRNYDGDYYIKGSVDIRHGG